MEKRQELYHGKAKTVYTTDDPITARRLDSIMDHFLCSDL